MTNPDGVPGEDAECEVHAVYLKGYQAGSAQIRAVFYYLIERGDTITLEIIDNFQTMIEGYDLVGMIRFEYPERLRRSSDGFIMHNMTEPPPAMKRVMLQGARCGRLKQLRLIRWQVQHWQKCKA